MLLVRPLCSFSLLPAVSPHHSYTFIISSFLIGVIGFVTSKYKVCNLFFLEKENQKVTLQAKKDTQHNLHFSNLNSFTVYLSMQYQIVIQSPIILPLSSSHPAAALIFHFWRKREKKMTNYHIVCTSSIVLYIDAARLSPLLLTSYSANNLQGWPRFSNPPLQFLLQEGGKKTKINLHPLCQARVLSENIRTQVCISRSQAFLMIYCQHFKITLSNKKKS